MHVHVHFIIVVVNAFHWTPPQPPGMLTPDIDHSQTLTECTCTWAQWCVAFLSPQFTLLPIPVNETPLELHIIAVHTHYTHIHTYAVHMQYICSTCAVHIQYILHLLLNLGESLL